MKIGAKLVKELRDRTGAGMMDCKRALEETGADIEAAIDLLRSKGEAKAAKRAARAANEGTVASYIHHGGRIGVLLELNCETDFVANTDDFRTLARDLAMHVAAADPIAVAVADVDARVVARERKIFLEQVAREGKPEHIRDRIVEGKLGKFFKERVLLEQGYVRDPDRTVGDLITEVSARTGEKIRVARFSRFQVGG
ncbi:MAG: translation elongation factor Ts [Gemmatimonadota bacterium]|nr:translation elongation factor Ts [Gemmatimonadota bacterium]MDE2871604.1 translation elongation factor Ts [Gemmatimonadota bacterium]